MSTLKRLPIQHILPFCFTICTENKCFISLNALLNCATFVMEPCFKERIPVLVCYHCGPNFHIHTLMWGMPSLHTVSWNYMWRECEKLFLPKKSQREEKQKRRFKMFFFNRPFYKFCEEFNTSITCVIFNETHVLWVTFNVNRNSVFKKN